MEDIKLPFGRYTNVSKKNIKKEIIRQENILNELKKDPEANSTLIIEVENNLTLLAQKSKHSKSLQSKIVFDKVFKWTLWTVLVVYCASLLLLPIWMFLNSFKDYFDYLKDSFTPTFKNLTFENYKIVFQKMNDQFSVLGLFGNSVFYSIGGSLIGVAATTLMAYVIAKYRFPGRNFIYNLGIVLMIVPIIGSLPSAMQIRGPDGLGTYNNIFLTIITSPVTAFSGLNFLLLYGNFKSLPWDYAEAVFVDGGNDYSAFFNMYLPMALPTCAVIFILGFLGNWNDYNTFMIWLPDHPNIAFGLYQFTNGVHRGKIMDTQILAGFAIALIPTVALYLASQKLILSKFTVGGLKG